MTSTPNFDAFSDDQLSAELERRRNLEALPGQVAAITTLFLSCGGERRDLIEAVTDAPSPESAEQVGDQQS